MKTLTLILFLLALYLAYWLGSWNVEYRYLLENAELRRENTSLRIKLEAYSDALTGKMILEQLGLPEKKKVEGE